MLFLLTDVEPICCSQSPSRFSMLSIARCFSAHHRYTEWLSGLLQPLYGLKPFCQLCSGISHPQGVSGKYKYTYILCSFENHIYYYGFIIALLEFFWGQFGKCLVRLSYFCEKRLQSSHPTPQSRHVRYTGDCSDMQRGFSSSQMFLKLL